MVEKNNVLRKGLVIGIILLFVGASVLPSMCGDPSDPGSEIALGYLGQYEYSLSRKLARTSDGTLHCVYFRLEGSYHQIYYSYSTDEGETWHEKALTSENYDQINPAIAIDSNDYLHVVWQGCHLGSPDHPQIRYRKYTTVWGAIVNITTDTGWTQRVPTIAVDSNDNLHVVWQKIDFIGCTWCWYGCGPLYHSKYTNSWSAPVRIGEGDQYMEEDPAIAVDGNDYLHVAWSSGGYRNGVCWHSAYRRYTDSWQPVESFECYACRPSIAVDSEGNVHFVSSYGAYSSAVKYRKRTASGWEDPEIIAPDAPGGRNPSIAIDGNDYLHVAWNDNGNIKYRKKTSSWQATETIISDTDSVSPKLIWSWYPEVNGMRTNIPKNGFAFVWNDGDMIKFYKSADLEWESGVNQPPNLPTNPQPGNDEAGVSLNPTLSVDVSDPNGDTLDVTFYDVTDGSVIGTDYNVPSGSTATTTWSGLYQGTTYFWCTIANDGIENRQSSTWSFTTNQPPTASFNVNPPAGQITTIFEFDALSCSDIEDDTADLKIRWDWENDGIWDTDWTTNKITSHQYNPESTYTVYEVKLAVKDTDDLDDYTTKEIIVYFDDGDDLTESIEWWLANLYFPILYYDSAERCYPTNMIYHLNNSNLNLSNPIPFQDDFLLKSPPILLDNITNLTNPKISYYMDNIQGDVEDNSNIISHYENNKDIYKNVTYVHVKKDKFKGITYTAIQYWFFYVFNDAKNNHEGDWELVEVLLDENEVPAYVACSQHWGGERKKWDDIIFRFGNHVMIFVANGSHANYFEPFADPNPFYGDIARGDGNVLQKDNMQLILLGERNKHPKTQNWLDYAGCWGDWSIRPRYKGPKGPMYRYKGECWDSPAKWALQTKLKVWLMCPTNLTITDNQSRKIGIIDGEFVNEIPSASADIFGDIEIYYLPTDLTYTYEVKGHDYGTYNFSIFNELANISINATNIPIFPNALHQYTINWSALSQGEEGVTLQIDSDGDGVFEKTITSDNELTHDEFMLQTETELDIDPDTLNINSTGKWITCYIELPENYNVSEINISTILLNNSIFAETHPTNISDYDNDSILDIMVKFDRQDIINILELGDSVEIIVSGKFFDETKFEGADYIKVI